MARHHRMTRLLAEEEERQKYLKELRVEKERIKAEKKKILDELVAQKKSIVDKLEKETQREEKRIIAGLP